jgi:formylmethanofuran dehydrogenase subunit B
MPAPSAAEPVERRVDDVVCTHCGCLCDDIQITISSHKITAAGRACPRGEAWFLSQPPERGAEDVAQDAITPRCACRIAGRPAPLAEGIEQAARMLVSAQAPLIYGLTETSCTTQRLAAGIADILGGTIDTPTSQIGPVGLGLQGIGEVTATLGEITNRSDFIIYWGCDPAADEPRHFERYTLDRAGMFIPNGRADRTCVVVDRQPTATAATADQFIPLGPGKDFVALWTLRAIVQHGTGAGTEACGLDPAAVEQATGQPLEVWQQLAARMSQARLGAIFFDSHLFKSTAGHWNGEALLALVHDLNRRTRFVARSLRGPGNPVGADNVLAWRTGYPYAVNFAAGYPRFSPDDFSAARLIERGEVDLLLCIAADPLPLAKIPLITVDWRETPTTQQAAVSFTTATYGIHEPGLVYRTDDVPLALRPILKTSLPSDAHVLALLEARIRELQSVGSEIEFSAKTII